MFLGAFSSFPHFCWKLDYMLTFFCSPPQTNEQKPWISNAASFCSYLLNYFCYLTWFDLKKTQGVLHGYGTVRISLIYCRLTKKILIFENIGRTSGIFHIFIMMLTKGNPDPYRKPDLEPGRLKGIVLRDWKRLQWILSDQYEEHIVNSSV